MERTEQKKHQKTREQEAMERDRKEESAEK